MLILSRNKLEGCVLTIGDVQCVISIVDVHGDKVRLGFEAPLEVTIHRKEVQEKIDRLNQQAAERENATL